MGLFAVAVVGTAADRMSVSKPMWERVVPRAFSDNAWRTRATLAIQRGDPSGAVAAARAGVDSGPIEPASSELLGSARLLARQPEAADQAFRVAGQLGWRRPATQVYWMHQALAGGDYRIAVMRLDAMLRQTPRLSGDPQIMRVFEDGRARPALLARLASQPPWLDAYARSVDALDLPELRERANVLQRLPDLGVRVGCEAIGGIVSRLVGNGEAMAADALWHGHCPTQAAGLAGDGNFRHTDLSRRASLFSWWAPADSDVNTSLDGAAAPAQPRMLVTSSSPFVREIVNRMIFLPPGHYRLQWQAVTAGGEASDRIVATLGCRQGSGEPLLAGIDRRSGLATALVTVNAQCPAQWFSFGVRPGAAELRFGNVRIDRVE